MQPDPEPDLEHDPEPDPENTGKPVLLYVEYTAYCRSTANM
jgi:hypothetical protein